MSEKDKETKLAEVKEQDKEIKKVEDKKVETKSVETKKTENKKVEVKPEKKEEKKKFEVKENQPEEENGKKNSRLMAPIITILAVIATVVLLTYMIVTSSDPKKTTDGFLTNLKAGDFEKAQEFVSGNEEFLNNTEFDYETKALLFDKISWKVTKVTKEDDKATVDVEITNKNFEKIISNCMKKVLEDFRSILNGNSVEESTQKYFIEELKNDQVETTTATKTIQLVKEEGKWKVVSNDELVDAVLPGWSETINKLK